MSDTLTFTHAQLAISPLNVRFNEQAIERVEALSASIVEEGQLQNLLVHPCRSSDDSWAGSATHGVYAGGRRWRAIGLAIKRGQLPADFPIRVTVRDQPNGLIILDSAGENLLREDLTHAEVHAAIARAEAEGIAVQEIADRLGHDLNWVKRQLRLGTLVPKILAAYRSGSISLDQAEAFAATSEPELQQAAWQNFRNASSWEASAQKIRAFYKVGDSTLARHLLFVGEAVYRGRGGRFEYDLFADRPGDRGRIVDETLLATLVQEKRSQLCDRIRKETGRSDLVFQPEPPKFGQYPDHTLSIDPPKGKRKLPQGDIVATIDIDDAGEWHPHFWWASRKAKGEALKPKSGKPAPSSSARNGEMAPQAGEALSNSGGTYDQRAREIARDEHGLTEAGLQSIRSIRRAILRGLLIHDGAQGGTLARDYLTWSQLRSELTDSSWAKTGARPVSGEWSMHGIDKENTDVTGPQLEEVRAEQTWRELIAQVSALGFIAYQDEAEAFLDFVSQPDRIKRAAECALAGLSLIRSANTPGYRVPVHDTLAELAGGTNPQRVRQLWEPGAKFTGLFAKLHRLALAQPFVDPTAFKAWHKLKDKPMAGAVAGALQGVESGTRGEAAKRWVHPLLAFGEPEEVEGVYTTISETPVEELEAAE